jgi:EmrB/QacA subfamily drug resistance transporter
VGRGERAAVILERLGQWQRGGREERRVVDETLEESVGRGHRRRLCKGRAVRGVSESKRPWVVLAAMTLALLMLTIDSTVVRVALPTIQRELHTSALFGQWIVNAYLLAQAVFVIVGGRAGDLYGRRRVFLVGLVVFTACSLAAGLAGDPALLLIARVGQGLGSAVMLPGTFSIVTDAFEGAALGRAMAIVSTTAVVGVSAGPLIGGALTEYAGWRWIFYVNIPIAVASGLLALAVAPESRARDAPRIDFPGLVVLVAAVTGLTLALMQVQSWGWGSARVEALLGVSLAGLVAFGFVERRARAPLVDLRLLWGQSLAANTVGTIAQFAMTGLVVLAAIYLQDVLGFSPFGAGAALLPLLLPGLFGSLLAGRLLDRFGGRELTMAGMWMTAAGMLVAGIGADVSDRYLALVPGFVLTGIGYAVVFTALTTVVMGSAPSVDRGVVSGVYNTTRNIGGALGVALMGAVLVEAANGPVDKVARRSFDLAFASTLEWTSALVAVGAVIAWAARGHAPRAAVAAFLHHVHPLPRRHLSSG